MPDSLLDRAVILLADTRPLPSRVQDLAVVLTERLDVEACLISRLDGCELVALGAVGLGAASDPRWNRLPVSVGLAGKAAREGCTIRVDDVLRTTDYFAALSLTRSELVVPVRRNGTILGIINLEAKRLAAFSADAERDVEAIAERLSVLL